jgi:hypothetical protein
MVQNVTPNTPIRAELKQDVLVFLFGHDEGVGNLFRRVRLFIINGRS